MTSTVRDVMVSPALAVSESTHFKQIVALLERERIEAVPVVDAAGVVVGVVGEEDLLVKEEGWIGVGRRVRHPGRGHTESRKLHGLVAHDVMSAPAVTIRPDATVAAAARLMTERGVGRLPVVDDDGRPVGMVARRDLLTVFLRPDREIRDEIVHRVLGDVFGLGPGAVPVRVEDGVVTLEGRVERRSELRVLAGLVEAVEGVVGVEVRTTSQVDDTTHLFAETPWRAFTGAGRV
ncbi:MAG TPA: CBS domain-containing protein [Actinomycetota bacterium]|nr:CBS domain-containing protein [Actinomycetota bacterium]